MAARPWLGPERYPFLRFHDRVIEPLVDNRFSNGVISILVSFWFLVALPLAYALIDRRPGQHRSP